LGFGRGAAGTATSQSPGLVIGLQLELVNLSQSTEMTVCTGQLVGSAETNSENVLRHCGNRQ
jgi:hypothetical protein